MRGAGLRLAATLFVALCGCGSDDAPVGVMVCEPSIRQSCACEIGTGMQDCAADGLSWDACICPLAEVTYTPAARPVDLQEDPAVAVTGTIVRVPRAGHADVAALQPGDVLVHYGSPPLLRRILAKRMEGDTIVLETRVAGLQEAFESLTLRLRDTRLNMYGALPVETRQALEAGRIGLSGGAGGLSFGAAGSIHPSISISDTSNVWFEPTLDADLVVNAGGLQQFTFVLGLDAGFDITTTVGLTGTGSVSVELELIEAILSLLVPPIRPPEINIPIGGGLSVSPKITLGCTLEVDGTVEITSRVHTSFDVRGGVEYVNGRPGDDWRLVSESSVTGGAELVSSTYQAGAQLTCYVRPRLELSFLEVVTGYGEVGPEAISKVRFGKNPYFAVRAGVRGTVGYSIGLDLGEVSLTIFEDSYDLFNLSQLLYLKEFSICGDGFRQLPRGGVAEDCDTGLMSTSACVDCRCAPLTIPVDFRHYMADDASYQWGGMYNRCRTSCWNRTVDPGELCDEGGGPGVCPSTTTIGCSGDCLRRTGVCGDGIVECGEGCDDGNTTACDGCDADCRWTDNCGNRYLDWQCGEQCDDGNTNNLDGCTNACTRPFCGNGTPEMGEACDDGNTDDCDGCHNDCTVNVPACGDYHVCGGEDCDNGAPIDFWNCDSDCTTRVCGDGYRNPLYEECDDGNTNDCDGCHNDCTTNVPSCGDGHTCGGEDCDESGADTWACDADCTLPVCGDGHVNPLMERCDDGDTDNCTTACNAFCGGPAVPPRCGNNLPECGEVCDDGPYNGMCGSCAADCMGTFGVCGDGVTDVPCGEVCDDSNTVSGDGCRGNCRGIEICGDRLIDVGELCDDGMPAMCMGDCNSTCTARLVGTCGDGTITPPCEVCEDTVPTNTAPDMGCTTSEPHCAACRRCSADVCGDGIQGPSEGCEVTRYCRPVETITCMTLADCPGGSFACDPLYGPGLCDPTCTRVETCGDRHVDGLEVCDDGNTLAGDGCNPTCSGP